MNLILNVFIELFRVMLERMYKSSFFKKKYKIKSYANQRERKFHLYTFVGEAHDTFYYFVEHIIDGETRKMKIGNILDNCMWSF